MSIKVDEYNQVCVLQPTGDLAGDESELARKKVDEEIEQKQIVDFVIDLDRRNPQTAARLLVSFRSWRALESKRRALAEGALKRVAEVADLSTDTRDIVTRTLA